MLNGLCLPQKDMLALVDMIASGKEEKTKARVDSTVRNVLLQTYQLVLISVFVLERTLKATSEREAPSSS